MKALSMLLSYIRKLMMLRLLLTSGTRPLSSKSVIIDWYTDTTTVDTTPNN